MSALSLLPEVRTAGLQGQVCAHVAGIACSSIITRPCMPCKLKAVVSEHSLYVYIYICYGCTSALIIVQYGSNIQT